MPLTSLQRLPRQGLVRLVGVNDALVAAQELGDNNSNRNVIEKSSKLFGLYRLRELSEFDNRGIILTLGASLTTERR